MEQMFVVEEGPRTPLFRSHPRPGLEPGGESGRTGAPPQTGAPPGDLRGSVQEVEGIPRFTGTLRLPDAKQTLGPPLATVPGFLVGTEAARMRVRDKQGGIPGAGERKQTEETVNMLLISAQAQESSS